MEFDFEATEIKKLSKLLTGPKPIEPNVFESLLVELASHGVQQHLQLGFTQIGVADILEVLSELTNRRIGLAHGGSLRILGEPSPFKWTCNKATTCANNDEAHRNGANTGCCKVSKNWTKDTWRSGLDDDAKAWRMSRGLGINADVVFFANPGSRELFVTDL